MNAQAAALAVELRRVANLGISTNWTAGDGLDFGEGRVAHAVVRPEWTIAQPPPGTLAVVRLMEFAPAALPKPKVDVDADWQVWARSYEVVFSVLTATNELTAVLPELAGHRLHSDAPADAVLFDLNPKVAAALERTPQAVLATFQVALIAARTVVTVPLRQGSTGRVGEMRLSVHEWEDHQRGENARHLLTRQPYRGGLGPLQHYVEPDLFLFRNPVTKETFSMGWNEVASLRDSANHTTATLLSPSRQHPFCVWDCALSGLAPADSRRFTEAWLDQAEVLGVRLTLVGWSQRTVRLENFQLEPAGR